MKYAASEKRDLSGLQSNYTTLKEALKLSIIERALLTIIVIVYTHKAFLWCFYG